MKLLRTRRFLPLMITQFFGALNDNLFKNALLILVTLKMTEQSDVLSNIIAGLFILPFFLFSATAGEFADKYSRNMIARILKVTELLLMLGVAAAWYCNSLPLLVFILAMMGVQSSFFGPVKYSLLPQHLKSEELITGNAYIESTTYMAILLGLVLGTLLPTGWTIVLLVFLACVGLVASWFIPNAPAPRPNLRIRKNILGATYKNFCFLRKHKVVWRSILGATWFWIIGALVAVQIYPICGQILNTSEGVITFFLVLFSVGVAAGSYVCNRILKGFIHVTYVPISAVGMAFCLYCIYFLTDKYPTPEQIVYFKDFFRQPHALGLSVSLFMLAFFGGLYIIPLNALMQSKAPKSFVATVIAGNNILNAFGMTAIAIFAAVFLSFGFGLPHLFLIMSVVSAFVAICICKLLPEALPRSVVQSILNFLFGCRIEGISNFRKAGKRVLIVANHVSLLDGILIAAFMPERITFAINTEWTKKWFMPVARLLVDFYPIDSRNPLSVRKLIDELKKNKKIMIFPEGRITVTGSIMKIYEGAGVIAQKAGAKILPVRINGAQYSKFSYLKRKIRTRYFPEISMNILEPCKFVIDGHTSRRDYRKMVAQKMYDVMVNMVYKTSEIDKNIFDSLLDAQHIFGKQHIIAEDINRKPQSYKSFIFKSYVLGTAYKKVFATEDKVGIMLPNVLANVVSFFALQYADKTPAMLNFTLGITPFLSAIKTVDLRSVVTSRAFIEQAKLQKMEQAMLDAGIKLIYLEEFASQISLISKLVAIKNYLLKRRPTKTADETAVILFTSGSEGSPKAVLLSHRNLQSNRYQIASIIPFNSTDSLFNALPMFHSFGLSVATVLPILFGVKVFLYPSPLHYRIVPELCYDTVSTAILGTDTFFAGYGKMANPYDFFSLKYAIIGGEKLKKTTADLWMKKFGVRILEGYGATETSPVLSINTPMHYKEDSVGRLIPGVESKIEPITGVDKGGRLLVKGDNIMQGYMKEDRPNVLQPLKDGWYDTGDIVSIDEMGYLTILGRAKRFAKIGGEMVSLTAVEQILDKLYPQTIQGILTAPDEKKGEQLILVTNNENADIKNIREHFRKEGLSELWMPKKVVYLAKPPVLASGKFDYVAAKEMLQSL